MTGNEPEQWWGGDRAPRPGIVPLRSLGAGDIVDGGVRFVRANPVAVLVPALVLGLLGVAVQALQSVLLRDRPAGDVVAGMADSAYTALPFALVGLVVTPPATATLLATLHPAVLGRRGLGLGEAWASARPRLGAIYGVQVVTTVIGLLPSFLLMAAAGPLWRAGGVGAAAGALLLLAGYLLLLWVTILLVLAPASAVVEGLPARDALWRSVQLVRGSWWRCLGIQIVVGLCMMLPVLVLGLAGGLLALLLWLAGGVPVVALVFVGLGLLAGLTLGYGFSIGATGLLAQDQRIRREGYDADLAREAGV